MLVKAPAVLDMYHEELILLLHAKHSAAVQLVVLHFPDALVSMNGQREWDKHAVTIHEHNTKTQTSFFLKRYVPF